MTRGEKPLVCLCGSQDFEIVFEYRSRPEGEISFKSLAAEQYVRDVYKCRSCGHFVSVTPLDLAALYAEDYISSTYGDSAGLIKRFEKIISLPVEKSDNKARSHCVTNFFKQEWKGTGSPSVLDVGAGLGVFAYEMKKNGFTVSGIEPDPRSGKHLENTVGIRVYVGDFCKMTLPSEKFSLVTLNKVLEHVVDPVSMLQRVKEVLAPKGLVYIELPDGEMAAPHGSNREEFFIDHFHVFSKRSTEILAKKAGFIVREISRLQEPSTKFTIRAFLEPA